MRSWAAMLIAPVPRVPRSTAVAVEALPADVFSVLVQPVVLPVLMAVALAMPAMVKVRVGSTLAVTSTDSMVPILVLALSILTLLLS